MRRVHIVLFLLVLCGCLPQASLAGVRQGGDSMMYERAADYYYLQALSLVEQDKYDAAFDMLEHSLALQPASSAVLFELVNMYQYLGRKDAALSILKKIVRENPQNYQFWLALVQYYDNEADRDAALKVYEEMSLVFPDKSEVFLSLSARYVEMARYPEAIAALERYETIEGRSEIISIQKYRMYVIMQRLDDALAELKTLSAENPDDLRFRVMEADAYYMLDKKEKALEIYHEVLEKDEENLSACFSLVEHYKAAGNDSLYVQLVEGLLKNEQFTGKERVNKLTEYINFCEKKDYAGSFSAITKLFETLMALPHGVLEAAVVYSLYLDYSGSGEEKQMPILNKILSLEPDNLYARKLKIKYAAEHNDFDKIIAECDTAIMYHPDILAIYHYKALARYFLGDKASAVEVLKQGIEKSSADTSSNLLGEVYALLGDILHEEGDVNEAFKAYDASLSYDDTDVVVLNNYAYYLALENRDLERALEMSYRTLKAEPDEPIYVDTYAWILFLLERYDEARECADKILSSEVEVSPVVLHHCGDIYSKSGDIEKALECWQKAQEKGDETKILKRKIKKKKYIPDVKKK